MQRIGILSRWIICPCVIFICLSSGFGQQKQSTSSNRAPIKIGIIKDGSLFEDNGGCALQLPTDNRKNNERFIFLSDYDGNGLINLDGKDIKLKLRIHKNASGAGDEEKVGSKSMDIFDGPGVTIKVDYIATWVCPPDDESCEITLYDATVTITRRKASKTVKVKGLC
jgi:hypothetical protein